MSEWDAFPLVGAEPAAGSDDPWAAFPIVQPPAPSAQEPTNMGAARELVKGIPSGAVGIVGTGISGAAALDTAIDASAEGRARNLVGYAMFALRDDKSPENRRRVGENLIREAAREYERMPDSEGAFAVNQIARQIIAGKEPDMSLLPEAPGPLKDDPLFKAGEAVSEFGKGILPARPGYEDSTARMLGEGLGSLLGGVAVSVVPGVGAVAGGVLFTSAGSGEAVQRAIAEGATEEQVLLAAKRGLIPGATDLAPVEILLGRLPNPLRTVATKLIGDVGVPKFVEAVGKIGAQAAIEAFQEGGQQALQNAIERYTYNPDQAIAEGVAENAALGGGVGAIAEAGKLALQGFAGRRGGTPPQEAAPPPPTEPAPPASPMLALPAPALITPPPEGAITLDPRDTAAAAGPRSGPYAAPPESAILLASGEAPEDIMAMNPAERAAAAQEATELGVAPLSQAESDAAMQPVVAAYDAERPDSPRITDDDRASAIPTGLIDDGKAEIDALIAGLDPRNPAEAALVTPPPVAPLASAAETPATAPAAPAAAGVAPQGDMAAPLTTPARQTPFVNPPSARRAEVITADGIKVDVAYEAVDANALTFAEGLDQPRDRSKVEYAADQAQKVANLDPLQLLPARLASTGAPIVGPNGVIESGNGRIMALKRAKRDNPEAYARYLDEMRKSGFDVDALPEGAIPVVVGRRVTEMDPDQLRQWVKSANASNVVAMSAAEKAQADVDSLTPDVLALYQGQFPLTSAANTRFVNAFLAKLPDTERSALTSKGELNSDGMRRVRQAIFARAYGDKDIVARVAEGDSDAAQSILSSLVDFAPEWAAFRGEIASGAVRPEFDITANILGALRLITKAREDAKAQGRPVQTVLREAVAQDDIFGGSIPAETVAVVRMLHSDENLTRAIGKDRIAARLSYMLEEFRAAGSAAPGLFGDEAKAGPKEAIDAANRKDRGADADLFSGPGEPDGARDPQGEPGGERPGGREDGAANEPRGDEGEGARGEVEAAAAEADPAPTDPQKEAGNYKKGHARVQGLDITIENARGSMRTGRDSDGEQWSVEMPAHYGYIKRTEGADGDQVDVYLGDMPDSDLVVIVNQVDPETGAFDEHKVILGAGSRAAALGLYERGFSDGKGRQRIGSETVTTMEGFKAWLKEGDLTKPTQPVADRSRQPLGEALGDKRPLGPQPSGRAPAAPTIEPFTEKSLIVRGVSQEDGKTLFAGMTGKPAWNAKEGAWVFSKKREDEVRERLGSSGQEPAATAKPEAATPAAPEPASTAPTAPIADARAEAKLREARAAGRAAALANEPRNPPDWMGEGNDLADAWLQGYGEGIAQRPQATPAAAPAPQPARPATYGASNSLVSSTRAEEIRKKLRDKLGGGTLNAGIDPEVLSLGAELAVYHVEAGSRKFAQVIRAIAADLGMEVSSLRRYGRAWYNGARNLMEDSDVSIDGMDDDATVRAQMDVLFGEAQAPAQPAAPAAQADAIPARIRPFVDFFEAGSGFVNIVGARSFARDNVGEMTNKEVEETIEAAIVHVARRIAQGPGTPQEKYRALVDLYGRQPLLAERTSTSVENQAYSTPAPLAYVASQLAGVSRASRVYEPSAGNGMLLMEASKDSATANELDPVRAQTLRDMGWSVITGDAMENDLGFTVDVVIANPPFGKVRGDDGNKRWSVDGLNTAEVDHAISLKALSEMKDGGRAVLIIGGKMGDERERVLGYRADSSRGFMNKLYQTYNVVDHFTVDGPLYRRQGAGWPVDVIVIEGRGASTRDLPMKTAPTLYSSWESIEEKLNDRVEPARRPSDSGRSDTVQSAGEGADAAGVSPRPVQQDRPTGSEGAASGGNARPGGRGGAARPGQQPESGGRNPDGGQRPSAEPVGDATVPGPRVEGDAQPGRGGAAEGGNAGGVPQRASERARVERQNTEAETNFQVQYSPTSNARYAVGTLIPKNMQTAIDSSLARLGERVGDIDDYVAKNLGYSLDELLGTEAKPGYFSAEQVDALALAISNIEGGAGFVIGDQTGVGKGRFVAAMLRYAMRQNRIPVFVTKDPGLYSDMIRDLRDIGMKDIDKAVLITNNGLRGDKAIPLDADNPTDVLQSLTPSKQTSAIQKMAANGSLPEGVKMIFTTYSQLQYGAKGAEIPRQRAILNISPNAMFVLDESHEAGGTDTKKVGPDGEIIPTRADFVRQMLRDSAGVVYSSATYAKNPTVMSLYYKTDLSMAVENLDDLADAISKGGVPLQQVVANMLVRAGQYARRERSYEGVDMALDTMPTDTKTAEGISNALSSIFATDTDYMEAAREAFIEEIAQEGGKGGKDNAVGDGSISGVGFSSLMHNVISQALLSLKAPAVVDKAIALAKAGEKPIIAVSNTNEAIISDYIEDEGLGAGAPASPPFNTILLRYLERTRRITVKDANDNKSHVWMSDADIDRLGPEGALDAMKEARKFIQNLDLSALPASPIDYILDRLNESGIRSDEITGRGVTLRNGIVTQRAATTAAKKRVMNDYNSGKLDGLVINRSGSTGFSMHATDKKGNDGKPRHMLILQADSNIDVFMQMLGRIHRTGQIKLPRYTIAISDLAIEKRPAAVLMRKMASLSANTTASKKSAISLEGVDFLNQYGDEVVADFLRENRDIAAKIAVEPQAVNSGIAAKMTGRLAIMAPKEVDAIYQQIERTYADYIASLDAMGMNALEAKTLDLQAETLSSTTITEGEGGGSPFAESSVMESVRVRRLGKPYSPEEIAEKIDEAGDFDMAGADRNTQAKIDALAENMPAYITQAEAGLARANEAYEAAKTEKQKDRANAAISNWQAAISGAREKLTQITSIIADTAPGSAFILRANDDQGGIQVYAVSLGADISKAAENPTAASRISIRFAIADPSKELRVPISKLIGEAPAYSITPTTRSAADRAFEDGGAEATEVRQMLTGNILAGYAKIGRGQIVLYTDAEGMTREGVLMPRDFDVARTLERQPVEFRTGEQVMQFLRGGQRMVKTSDGIAAFTVNDAGRISISVNRKSGKPYYLNREVRAITGEFSGRQKAMVATAPANRGAEIVNAYMEGLGARFETTTDKDAARAITGDVIPDIQRERRGEAPSAPVTDAQLASLQSRMDTLLPGVKVRRETRPDRRGAFTMTRKGETVDATVLVSSAVDAEATLDHEAIHALYNLGLFTEAEWAALSRRAEQSWIRKHKIKERYPEADAALLIEEAIAEEFAAQRAKADALEPMSVRKALAKIGDVLEAIGNWARGLGFQSAADVFGRAGRGEVGRRDADEGREASRERVDTSTAAFRKWFGKSKVVDANGEPLVVYHGTGADIEAFKRRRGDIGMHFGTAGQANDRMAYKALKGAAPEEGVNLMPVFLSIQNPLRLDDLGGWGADNLRYALGRVAGFRPEELLGKTLSEIRALIERKGFDGIVYKNTGEVAGYAERIAETEKMRRAVWERMGLRNSVTVEQQKDAGYQAYRKRDEEDREWAKANAEDSYIAFRPEQIKSAFNRGTWNPDSPLIRERRAPANSGAFETFEARSAHQITRLFTRLFTRFEAAPMRDAETWRDTYHIIRRNFADRFDPLKRQQEAIQEAGGNVGLAQDAYLAESLYHGRTGERLRDFYEGDVRGITKNLRDAEIAPKEMDDYLIARHVEERNRQMAKLREIEEPNHQFVKALTDPTIVGGSGFSQAWANGVLRRVANDRRAAMFKEIARKADAINSARLDLEVSSGLTSQEAADAMRATYKFYVPLRGWEADEDGGSMGAGRGFDIRGQESKGAAGRTTRADSPLGTLLAMRANSIIRSEKNRVGKTFLRLVQANPNPAAWTVYRPRNITDADLQALGLDPAVMKWGEKKARLGKRSVTKIDPVTGLPVIEKVSIARDIWQAASRVSDNIMIVKVGGEEVLIRIENRDLARAMKNLNPENQSVLVRALGTITRWMSALNTTLNIEWFVTNLARDLQTAGIQISDENKAGLAKAMFKNWPGALRGAAEHLSGRGSSSWRAVAADFAAQGGKVDYIEFRDVQGFKELIEDEITEASLGRMVKAGPKALFEGIQIFTGAGENAIRIAAYKAALDMGIPKPKAASIARELTVNFNRKGELGPMMNALYMFFNAAVQGNMRLLQSVVRSKFTRKALVGLAIIGALEAMLGAGDDDEYEKIEPFIRERSIVIMFHPLGLGPKGSYGKIPLPYGFNVFKTIGTELGRVIMHGASPEEAASNVLGAAINSFNPIGGQDIYAVMTFTVLDPIADIYRNRNFFGSSIRPDYPNDQRPDSEKFFPNVNPVTRAITAWANDATGGNAFKEGAISVSPENIDHLLGSYLGGAGRFFPNLGRATWGLMTGEPLDAEKAPFVRQLYGETFGEMPTWRAYDSITDAVTALDYEIKGFRKAGQGEAVREAMERDPLLTSMLGPVKIAEKRVAALRKKEREIAARDMDEDARIEALALIRQQSLEAQRKLIEIWDRKRNPRS